MRGRIKAKIENTRKVLVIETHCTLEPLVQFWDIIS